MKVKPILSVTLAILFVALAGFVVWGIGYTNSSDFCNSCHIIEPYVETWGKSPMGKRGVNCVDCHFEPGAVGYARGKIYSLMKLAEYIGGQKETPPPSPTLLTSSACLQCHGEEPNPRYPNTRDVVDPADPTYPSIPVTDPNDPDNTIYFPHDFHVEKAQVKCAECHSGVTHGELKQDKPQAKAAAEFCSNCHSGDIAPILFGEIKPAGREHPGIPKIDSGIWRNIHWRFTYGPGEYKGTKFDKIERQTCLACHKDPTEAKNCKSCHFHTEPTFSPAKETTNDSRAPLAMFGFVALMWSVTLMPSGVRRYVFEGWIAAVVGIIVLATDVFAVYKTVTEVLDTTTGGRELGPATIWIAYLMASVSLLTLIFHQGVLKPRRRRLAGHDRD